ncbi:MAG: 1-deoxy-D-xylulose-5-phosphate reductoisomerase [Ignavibacteriae bacterium]|nr:MAG: 1-deoxy-D-xylulose-5-phosphate reductoisomerase [Ignavibacteriota bacterium]
MSQDPKHIALLGSTGSIGRNCLSVIHNLPDKFKVSYLTTNTNIELLQNQITHFHPRGVVVLDEAKAAAVQALVGHSVEVLAGREGLLEIVRRDDVDLVINSIVGFAGLKPTVEAIKHRKHIALANKETLVVAGELVISLVREYGVHLVPIDSEHSAILQCLVGEERNSASRIILTASGGPLLNTPQESFGSITVEQALNHPNWKMGNKITIDSATLMNKGLEVIEARWLFGLPIERIDVVIHPQSIIHSMVEFADGSIKAQLGMPDMKLPIQYALTYPDRYPMSGSRVDFPKLQSMTFFAPDRNKFRCLQLAYDAMAMGGTAPAIMNAANEIAVQAFLEKKIPFLRIPELIEQALAHQANHVSPDLEHTFQSDRKTREYVRTLL